MKKWIFNLIAVLAIVAVLFAVPKPAYAVDSCSPNVVSVNPANRYHAFYDSGHNLYLNDYYYVMAMWNQSGHRCHIVVYITITTSNGWYFQDYYTYNTGKGHVPYIDWPGAYCQFWNPSHTQARCDLYADQANYLGEVYWTHGSSYSNQHD